MPQTPLNSARFFQSLGVAGGEMATRMASLDWENTPVGRFETWPQSLRTQLQTLLVSRYPMILTWGESFTQFYNDAYSKLIGNKHPSALGEDIRVTMPESWGVLGPMIEEVMATGMPNWNPALLIVLERAGYREESYFTVSHAPARDDQGRIAGMFAVCSEVTQQVLSDRRLGILRDLAAGMSASPSLPQACADLARSLADRKADLPWATLYLPDPDGGSWSRATGVGIPGDIAAFPAHLGNRDLLLNQSLEPLLLGQAVRARYAPEKIPVSGGVFDEPVKEAFLLPIPEYSAEGLPALLVAGVSPNREVDDQYRTFFQLLSRQMGIAVRNARAADEERRRNEALTELDRAKTHFFSNVSHEFRTPLTLLLAPLEEALTSGSSEDRLTMPRETVAAAHRNALRLLKLVNSLLEFSRAEAGRLEAAFQPTDLAILTRELAAAFDSTIRAAGLKFTRQIPDFSTSVYVDRSMWEKVVLNLISNAYKHTFDGEIQISLHETEDAVELRVRDTGIGIPAADLPKIFARFHRVHGARSRSFEGSGIGLALVSELIRAHGGTVTAESEEGRGSVFFVTVKKGHSHLPADRVTDAPIPSANTRAAYVDEARGWRSETVTAAAASDLSLIPPSRAPRILLVDDNADMRNYVTRILSPEFRVEVAVDGEDALRKIADQLPDLILSDVMMPGVDGFGLLKQIRSRSETSRTPFVLLSARAGQESAVSGIEAGADDYLVKPFTARELLARVRQQLKMTRLRQDFETEQSMREALERSEDRFRQLTESLEKVIGERTEELTRSRKFLTSLIENNPNMVFVKDAQTLKFVEINRVGEELLGLARSDLVGKSDYDFFPREQADYFTARDRLVLQGRIVVDTPEEVIATQTRGLRILHTKKIPIFDQNGQPQFLLGVSEDISDKIEAERIRLDLLREQVFLEERERIAVQTNRLAEASTQLTASLDYQTTLDTLGRVGTALLGGWCTVTMVDEQGVSRRLVAVHPDPQNADLLERLAAYFPGPRSAAEGALAVIRTGVSLYRPNFTDEELRASTLDDEHYRIVSELGTTSVMIVPLGVNRERTHGAIAFAAGAERVAFSKEDLFVAEELGRRAGIAIENALLYGSAQKAVRARDEFLSIASHELKTPLTSLKLQLQMTRRGIEPSTGKTPPAEKLAKVFDTADKQVRRLTNLIEDLLDVSRIGAGRLHLRFEPVELAAMIRETVAQHRDPSDPVGSQVHVALPEEVIAECDRFRIEQVVVNLLSNAAKYGEEKPIRVSLTATETEALIHVADEGMGIPEGMQAKIFERFERAIPATNISGLGLGLYISLEIVRAHGGTIEVESKPGSGSRFTVRLPLLQERRNQPATLDF